jgi:hypothetical protein
MKRFTPTELGALILTVLLLVAGLVWLVWPMVAILAVSGVWALVTGRFRHVVLGLVIVFVYLVFRLL